MISRIAFKQPFGYSKDKTIFEKGLEVALEPGINVLVGDQGSTLIELARVWLEPDKGMGDRLHKRLRRSEVRETLDLEGEGLDEVRLLAFDFEKDAARTSSAFDFGGVIDTVGFLMHGNRVSHGEANKMALNMLLGDVAKEFKETGKVKPTIVMLDEPDAALSIASVLTLHVMLKNLEHFGCQIIVSAHNPFLLGCFKTVFSLEKKRRITYGDYLSSQLLANAAPGALFMSTYASVAKALSARVDDLGKKGAWEPKKKAKKKRAKNS